MLLVLVTLGTNVTPLILADEYSSTRTLFHQQV